MRQPTQGVGANFAHGKAARAVAHGPLDSRKLAGWLSGLGQLRSPAGLDSTILDSVHVQLTPRGARVQPALLLVVTLGCVVFGAVVKLRPNATAPGPSLARSLSADPLLLTVPVPAAPARLAAKRAEVPRPALQLALATTDQPLSVRPLDTYRLDDKANAKAKAKTKSALASRGFTPSVPQHATPSAVPPIRLAAVMPIPSSALPVLSPPYAIGGAAAEVIPESPGSTVSLPSVQLTNSLSLSGTGLVAAPIKLHAPMNGMVSTAGLLARVPEGRDSSHRPIYKRAWFLGVLGVAATGIAAGVTAAVVSSRQSAPSINAAGHPITLSLGPT